MVKEAALSNLFDIIGHMDLIKIFGFRPKENMEDIIMDVLEAIKKSKACVEINTNGWNRPINEQYPDENILKMCFEMGIPITYECLFFA